MLVDYCETGKMLRLKYEQVEDADARVHSGAAGAAQNLVYLIILYGLGREDSVVL